MRIVYQYWKNPGTFARLAALFRQASPLQLIEPSRSGDASFKRDPEISNMTDSIPSPSSNIALARRKFLFNSVSLTLSGAAIGLLAGKPALALGAASTEAQTLTDIRILNTALAAEHEAVAAYQAGAESGLLQNAILSVALTFQGHHKAHVDVLAKTISSLGGNPGEPKRHYGFPVDQLKSQDDVLDFAAGLERGAVSAYVGAIPLFENRDLSKAAASILADEAMHWAILRQALKLDPVPDAFYS